MTVERWVRTFAGLFILTSLALSRLVDPRFLWVTAFVGANLLQSSFTRFCPLAIVLERLGVPTQGKPAFRT